MSNHVHLAFRSAKSQNPELFLVDFKRFTGKALVKAIKDNPRESRKEWLLEQFEIAGAKSSTISKFQFWRHDSKPIELWSNKVIDEKINYIHSIPVEEGLVFHPEDYVYSSAKDYIGEPGKLGGVMVAK